MAQLCVLRVADMPVCFENNQILAFKGRSSRLAKRESFVNIVAIVPSCQKSHGVSKNESLAGGGGGGGYRSASPRAMTDIAGNRCQLWPEISPLNQEDSW
jgi:hypothetical protein